MDCKSAAEGLNDGQGEVTGSTLVRLVRSHSQIESSTPRLCCYLSSVEAGARGGLVANAAGNNGRVTRALADATLTLIHLHLQCNSLDALPHGVKVTEASSWREREAGVAAPPPTKPKEDECLARKDCFKGMEGAWSSLLSNSTV